MIIARIFGGLGNQLFIYSTARRLALKNNVQLKLDINSGFKKDPYHRKYCLNHFNIKAGVASSFESFEAGFGKWRRLLCRNISKYRTLKNRFYIKEIARHFDNRLLNLKVKKNIYLDGYWQCEKYFKDIKNVIQQDLRIITPRDPKNIELSKRIISSNAICIHVRRFDMANVQTSLANFTLKSDYYNKAIGIIKDKVSNPVFFCFGDYPEWLHQNIKKLPNAFILKNNGEDKNYEDLRLMSQCKHFIIANSSFSWWGAWLSRNQEKIVISPDPEKWSLNKDLVPKGWECVNI